MKLPRDLSGQRLATLLSRFGYETVRQSGSHMRLVSNQRGREHRVTIPAHRALSVGTLSSILSDVSEYLEMDKDELSKQLFG